MSTLPQSPAGALAGADTVIRNAHVHTVDGELPTAEALAVIGGRISWTGPDDEADAHIGAGTEVLDAGGRLVLPGFIDAHNHVRLGSDASCVQLAGARSLAEIGARIEGWLADHPEADWIEAEGFNYAAIPGSRMPTAADLDALTGNRPAFVLSYDVHTAWLNTEGMHRLGVTADSTELPFGVVQKDPETGRPTGFLTQFAVRGLSRDGHRALRELGVPWAALDRQYGRLCGSLEMANRLGLTTVVEPQNSLDDLALFERAISEGVLRSRLIAALFHPRGTTQAELAEFAAAARKYDSDRFRVGPLKLYIDDVVEPRTAAMLKPYAGCTGHRGETFYPPEEFAGLLVQLDAAGFQTFVHATGDRGIRTVLDAVASAQEANGPRDARHQIVHVECLDPADVDRFAQLGVVACMQPRHSAPDIAGPGYDWAEAVGPERWAQSWPMRTLHHAGAPLAFSSDWNVAEMDPLIGIYTAVTRRGLDGGTPWVPEETVDLATAIRAYTLGSAHANFAEHDRGSLTPGKLADLVVLSDDLFALPPEAIKDARVELTMVGGCVTHRTDGGPNNHAPS